MSENQMDSLITMVNEIYDAFAELKIDVKLDLPQIAVIGSQSSGKSSVLENVVGKDFLPRGSGIVTRCPIVLQLIQLPATKNEEWAEFLHVPGKKFFDFDEVRRELERRTAEVTNGVKGGVTSTPINVKVFSRHVLNLTVVDLPGLVMNAVGDQPKDIDRQIKDMVTNYVRPSHTIMLAVTPANADMATSAALKLARQLDPEGVRTLGVLTKLDLMDKGTDAVDMLEGKQIPLRLGFIGVVNRSQHDINERKSLQDAREKEKEFFSNNSAYTHIAETQGTEYLCKTLNKLLLSHIQQNLPDLRNTIDKLMQKTLKEKEALGMTNDVTNDPSGKILHYIKIYSDSIGKTIEGEATEGAKELVGGARIDYIFHECFTPYIMGLGAGKELTDDYIRLTIRNRSGMQSTLFPSDQVFITLSKLQIKRLEEPAVKCVSFVYDELIKIIDKCSLKAERYPTLRQKFIDVSQKLLQKYKHPTVNHVRTLISAEAGYINIKHPDMQEAAVRVLGPRVVSNAANGSAQTPQSGSTNFAGSPGQASNKATSIDIPRNMRLAHSMTQQETLQNGQIRDMVEVYFGIVKNNVTDQVPKVVALLMITKLCQELYPQLIQELYKEELFGELLKENSNVAAKIRATATMEKLLRKAQNALSKVKDIV